MANPKLNQVISIEKGEKERTKKELTANYKILQKPELFGGFTKEYFPHEEEGQKFPSEKKKVNFTVKRAIESARKAQTKLFNVVATKDFGNTNAKANVVVDDQVLLTDVPVTYLLFLEKQVLDLHTFVSRLPALPMSENWEFSVASNLYESEVRRTNKTKRVLRNHVKAEATKEHPAQVETYTEDVPIGIWETKSFSGAIPAKEKTELLEKVVKLHKAIQFAREEANSRETEWKKVGEPIFNYLFGDE